MNTPTSQPPGRSTRPQIALARKSATGTIVLFLLLVGGGIAGYLWTRQKPASIPTPVAVAPKPAPTTQVAQDAPPPVADFNPGQFDPNDPQAQAMMQQMTETMYGDVFAGMNLTPEQQDKVDALMMQRTQAVQGIFQNMFQQGGFDPTAIDPAQIAQQVDQAQAQANQSLQAVLGTANYQQLQARDQQLRQGFAGGGGFPGGGGQGGFAGPGQ